MIQPAIDLANHVNLIPRNCMAIPCLSSDGSLEGVVIAYNGKHSVGGFGKKDEVALISMGREFAAALALCQHEERQRQEFSRKEVLLSKWQEDATYLTTTCAKMLVALDLKEAFVAAHKRLRKLCEADFACVYKIATDVDGNEVLQYVPSEMFTEAGPDASSMSWIDLELTATLAGGCARKGQTLIISRGKVEALVAARPRLHAGDEKGMMWAPDLLTQYPNTQGPLKGRRRASMICVPVLDVRGAVAGVVQVMCLSCTRFCPTAFLTADPPALSFCFSACQGAMHCTRTPTRLLRRVRNTGCSYIGLS